MRSLKGSVLISETCLSLRSAEPKYLTERIMRSEYPYLFVYDRHLITLNIVKGVSPHMTRKEYFKNVMKEIGTLIICSLIYHQMQKNKR